MNNCFAENTSVATLQQAEELYKKLGIDDEKKRQVFIDMSKIANPFLKKDTKISYSNNLKDVTTDYLAGY